MIIVIIDFDNYFGANIENLNAAKLELAFSDIVLLCEKSFNNFSKISIRLYGGWHQNTSLTKQASIIQQMLSQITVFPKVGKIVLNGSIELVSSLYDIPDYIWHHTYKEKDGIPRIRINHDSIDTLCNDNRESCPKFLLYKFTAKKDKQCSVPGCNHIHKNVFKGLEQKMVDTLIACDIISVIDDENVRGVLVLSDDQDHFPSYAIAHKKMINRPELQNRVIVGVKNQIHYDFFNNLLSPFINIKLILMS